RPLESIRRWRTRNRVAVLFAFLAIAIPLRSPAQTPLTPQDLAAMTPGSPNPYLALLPTQVAPDWKYWNAYAAVHSPLRAEARAPLTRQTPVPIGEVEPNGSASSAQLIDIFGTGPGKVRSIEIHGTVGDAPTPIFSGTPA